MPVSASYWAMELRTISSKDRGALVFFAFSSSLAAAFAPAASSVAACFSAACGVQPARQHGERSAGAAICKLTFFAAFSAAAFSLLNPPRSSDGSGVPSADNPNNACDAVGTDSGRTRPAARRTLRRLSTRPRVGSRSEAACPRRSRREIVRMSRRRQSRNQACAKIQRTRKITRTEVPEPRARVTWAADHTRAAPRSSPGFFALAVSVTPSPCGTRSTAASLHSASWLISACVGNTGGGAIQRWCGPGG